jgi:feruloyl esterase
MRFAALVIFIACAAVPAIAASCEELAKLALPKATVSSAESVPAGTFQPRSGPPFRDLPAFCRVALVLKPSADSHIEAEVWLPSSGWNGKFQGVGNGGYAGAISFGNMAVELAHGYATASSDTGHHAGGTDAGWALNHPEKIVDFGYRAVHETTAQAKAIIKAFYGEGPKRSYFSSCSNGGRQALMEAQRYPADYDGIVAGAPASYWTHLLSAAVWDVQATTVDPASYIPSRKLPAIQAAALAACDNLDGVKDGVIENPAKCHFDPAPLLCKGEDSDSCLTAPQLAALKKIYAGPRDSSGKQVLPGYSPGGEAGAGGWAPWITGTAPAQSLIFAYGSNFFRNMVYNDPSWDYKTFTVDRDVKAADEKMARILNATDTDLKKFQDRGGKLILYHGWSDAAIPALATVDYYQGVIEKMGAQEAAGFVRLYMVPGMQHCGGGDGPSSFGQIGTGQGDALHNVDKALEQWVEQGVAPKQIVATKYKTGVNPASGVARTRPLCPYPQVAQWKGSGSTDDEANFVCK